MALFVSEIKNGNLKFESVKEVKFHFLQIPGWYFEVFPTLTATATIPAGSYQIY